MKKPVFSVHHIVPRSKNGSSTPQNTVKLVNRVHERFHTLFLNLTPHEQLEMWYSINDRAFTRETQNKIENILSFGEFIYKDWVLRPHE